jgi:hypothetical protein
VIAAPHRMRGLPHRIAGALEVVELQLFAWKANRTQTVDETVLEVFVFDVRAGSATEQELMAAGFEAPPPGERAWRWVPRDVASPFEARS